MKRLSIIFAAVSMVFAASCMKSAEDIISDFEFSVEFPYGQIVDGEQASFVVTSNRDWYLVDAMLSETSDFRLSDVDGLIGGKDAFGAGKHEFTVAGQKVSVSETHRSRLSLTAKCAKTGAQRTAVANYSAYPKSEYTLKVLTPFVSTGDVFRFRITSASSTQFVITSFKCKLPGADKCVSINQPYRLEDNSVEFSIPVDITSNILEGRLLLTVTDDTGMSYTLGSENEFCAINYSCSLNTAPETDRRIPLYSKTYKTTAFSTFTVTCEGGFTVSSIGDTGAVEFSQTGSAIEEPSGSVVFESAGNDAKTVYFRGTAPGLARIRISPKAAEGKEYTPQEFDVWVRPKVILYVDGQIDYVRNQVYGAELNPSALSLDFYTGKLASSGGWTGAPSSIRFSMRPVGAESDFTYVRDNYTLTNDQRTNGSLVGISSLRTNSAVSLSALPESDFLKADILSYGKILAGTSFDVTVKTEANTKSFPRKSKSFWWDGTPVAYALDEKLAHGLDAGRTERTVNQSSVNGVEFTFRNCELNGFVDSLVFESRPWFTYADCDVYSANLFRVVEDTPAFAGNYITTDNISPWHMDRLIGGSVDTDKSIAWFLNKYNDALVESGVYQHVKFRNTSKYVDTMMPGGVPSYAGGQYPYYYATTLDHASVTEWDSFGVRVKKIEYDQSLIDVVGVFYGFKLVNNDGSFVCGADYWWHSIDSVPVFVAAGDSTLSLVNKAE